MDWGTLTTISSPQENAKNLMVLEVIFHPGMGHSFHRHPRQEEVIYVLEGKITQWIGVNKQDLVPGDSVVIAADEVHASFNNTSENARILAILGPCIGEDGYEIEEAADPRS